MGSVVGFAYELHRGNFGFPTIVIEHQIHVIVSDVKCSVAVIGQSLVSNGEGGSIRIDEVDNFVVFPAVGIKPPAAIFRIRDECPDSLSLERHCWCSFAVNIFVVDAVGNAIILDGADGYTRLAD